MRFIINGQSFGFMTLSLSYTTGALFNHRMLKSDGPDIRFSGYQAYDLGRLSVSSIKLELTKNWTKAGVFPAL